MLSRHRSAYQHSCLVYVGPLIEISSRSSKGGPNEVLVPQGLSLGIRHINILGLGARFGILDTFCFFPFSFSSSPPSPFPVGLYRLFFAAKSLLTRFSRPIPPSTLSTLLSLLFSLLLSPFFYSGLLFFYSPLFISFELAFSIHFR